MADDPARADQSPIVFADASRIEVIVPNFKRRFTGVSATVAAVVPLQARALAIAALGSGLAIAAPRVRLGDLLRHGRSPPAGRPFRIWHARRNAEMLAGLLLRHLLRLRLKLVFTSAAIRHHSFWPRRLIAAMDAVIATTPEAAKLVPNVVAVIPHGVDMARFSPPPDKLAAWRESGLPGRYGIGIFGRIRPEKGTDIFVDAMCRLLPDYPDFTAIIAGLSAAEHRRFREDLERGIGAAGLAGRVVFIGHIDAADMPAWYRRCLIAVAPGRYEGYGLTVLEAMASGSAAIATPTGAYATMIDDGVSGRLLPAADADALVAALRPLLADPTLAEAMGRAGRHRAETFFSAAREAEAINAVYRELWGGSAPPARAPRSLR